ncbi:hypothetical protein MASR2M78_16730 [Treponema sp.]
MVDAAVLDVVRESRKDDQGKNLLTIVFRIKEGRSYLFGGISFEGNEIFSVKQLSDLVYLKEGQILNGKRLEADFQRVLIQEGENGCVCAFFPPPPPPDML